MQVTATNGPAKDVNVVAGRGEVCAWWVIR